MSSWICAGENERELEENVGASCGFFSVQNRKWNSLPTLKPLRDSKCCEDRLCLFPFFLYVYVCHTWTPRLNLSVPRWNKIVFSQFQVVSEKWVYLSWCSRITCCISSKTELACHPDWDREINTACWNSHYSGNSYPLLRIWRDSFDLLVGEGLGTH